MALAKVQDLGKFIRDQRRNARLSLRKVSQMAGISNPYLSQIERGLRRPSAEILQSIAKALRVSAETLYVKAGILEERGEPDPISALLNDRTINEKQRRLMIELYQSFHHENAEATVSPKPKRAAAAARTQSRARSTVTSTQKKKSKPATRAKSTKKRARSGK